MHLAAAFIRGQFLGKDSTVSSQQISFLQLGVKCLDPARRSGWDATASIIGLPGSELLTVKCSLRSTLFPQLLTTPPTPLLQGEPAL